MATQKKRREPQEENRVRDKQLNLRVDERTRFAIQFTSEQRGIAMSVWLDQQARAFIKDSGWEGFWDPSPAVRDVLRVRYKAVGKHDEELRAFVNDYADLLLDGPTPRRRVLDALWPKLGVYVEQWRKDPIAARVIIRRAISRLPKGARER